MSERICSHWGGLEQHTSECVDDCEALTEHVRPVRPGFNVDLKPSLGTVHLRNLSRGGIVMGLLE